jgi:lipopolysaccharide/colanic/teichoic acid biosynthesis glycosyltransferase
VGGGPPGRSYWAGLVARYHLERQILALPHDEKRGLGTHMSRNSIVGSASQASIRRKEVLKRVFDVLVSLLALLGLSVPMLVLAIIVRIAHGRPVLFRQVRPGRFGRPFEMIKFRTMICDFDERGILRTDAERLTALGRWLRATSLDELPELWNVLRGEMSLVGPRPLLMSYLPLYSPVQARRHEVRPGITGWAQINGRNALTWERKFDLDVWYVDNRSIWLDLKIIAITVKKVLVRDGINADGEATMPRFTGSK